MKRDEAYKQGSDLLAGLIAVKELCKVRHKEAVPHVLGLIKRGRNAVGESSGQHKRGI